MRKQEPLYCAAMSGNAVRCKTTIEIKRFLLLWYQVVVVSRRLFPCLRQLVARSWKQTNLILVW